MQSWVSIEKPLIARVEGRAQGATPYNHLEGLSFSPDGRALYIAETGEKDPTHQDPFGRVYRMNLKDSSLKVFYTGQSGALMNPDNLATDGQGNVWVAEDRSEKNIKSYGPNHIWKISKRGKACFMATIPATNCEPTGPAFSPDFKTLYVNLMCGDSSKTLKISGPFPPQR